MGYTISHNILKTCHAPPEADPLTTIPEKRPRGRPLGSVNKSKSASLERTKSNVDSVTLMEEFMAQEVQEAEEVAPQSQYNACEF